MIARFMQGATRAILPAVLLVSTQIGVKPAWPWARGTIITVAGDGINRFAGDGGPALKASLNYPAGLAVNSAGDLFIADSLNNRIRRVDNAGFISTVAGSGETYTDPQDVTDIARGCPNSKEALNLPESVAFDASRYLLIADDCRIQQLATNAGLNPVPGGDTVDQPGCVAVDPNGSIFVSEAGTCVVQISKDGQATTVAGASCYGFSGDGGLATQACIDGGCGLAVDNKRDIFIVDSANHRVRKIGPDGIINTIAGSRGFGLGQGGYSGDGGPAANARLNEPYAVVLDAAGDLFISDSGNNRIRKIDPSGIITTVAGNGMGSYAGDGGPATEAALNCPSGMTIDANGNLFFSDTLNQCVREVFGIAAPGLIAGKPFTQTSAPNPVAGDLNGDGKVTVQDALIALRFVVGLAGLDTQQQAAGDLNGDGRLTLQDVILILRKAVGL